MCAFECALHLNVRLNLNGVKKGRCARMCTYEPVEREELTRLSVTLLFSLYYLIFATLAGLFTCR